MSETWLNDLISAIINKQQLPKIQEDGDDEGLDDPVISEELGNWKNTL